MSANCNKTVILDDRTLEEKSSFGRAVSISIHAALNNCYKGIETLEAGRTATGAETVYFHAAKNKLQAARQGLGAMLDILRTTRLTEASAAWLGVLDYDRLYEVGTKKGLIPAFGEQWRRLVGLMKSLDHLAVTNCLIADVEDLQRKIDSVMNTELPASTDSHGGERIPVLQSALVQFSAFAQMVSYLNAVEPLDPMWRQTEKAPELMKVSDELVQRTAARF